jgi:hypothetical protein
MYAPHTNWIVGLHEKRSYWQKQPTQDSVSYHRDVSMVERRRRRLLQKLLSGSKNIRFATAVAGAEILGFWFSRINIVSTFTPSRGHGMNQSAELALPIRDFSKHS